MHPLNRRAPIKAQTHGIGDQVVDAQRDVELPRQGVNMEAAGAQEPCIIQADEALQRQKQQVMPGPIADPVGQTPPVLARQPSHPEGQGSGDPEVERGPALDKLPPPRQALEAIGPCHRECVQKLRIHGFGTMLGHQWWCRGSMHLQSGGRDRTGPHDDTSSVVTTAGVSVRLPSARR